MTTKNPIPRSSNLLGCAALSVGIFLAAPIILASVSPSALAQTDRGPKDFNGGKIPAKKQIDGSGGGYHPGGNHGAGDQADTTDDEDDTSDDGDDNSDDDSGNPSGNNPNGHNTHNHAGPCPPPVPAHGCKTKKPL